MPKISEAQHQAAVIKWSQQPSIREKWPELALLYHIPNGGTRDTVEGKHLKQQGTKRGVPDLHLPVAKGRYHSLYIEMKTATGRISPEQKWWGERLTAEGNMYRVCRGWESAVQLLEWYMNLQGPDDGG